MTLADTDWSVIRGSLVVFIGAVLVSVAVVSLAHFHSSGVEVEHRRETNRLSAARARYLTLDDEKRLIERYYPDYLRLQRQGAIGEEHRLNWIENLRVIAEQRKLPSLQYEISSQRLLEPDFPVPSGRFVPYASDMRLEMGLLHEEDLVVLLDDLERSALGTFTVANCQLRRTASTFGDDPSQANLNSTCRLRWITVKPEEIDESQVRRRRRR